MLAAENIFESEHVYLEEDLLGHEKIPDKKGRMGSPMPIHHVRTAY